MMKFLKLTFLFALSLFVLVSCRSIKNQFKKNTYDRHGKRHGLWITYWDTTNTLPMKKTWYKHGKKKWKSKSYNYNAFISVKFKDRGKRLKVKYYTNTGKLSHKGWAEVDTSGKDFHYYWQGKWKYFDTDHKLIREVLYEGGAPVDTLQ